MDKVHYNQIDYLVSRPILKRQPGYNGEASGERIQSLEGNRLNCQINSIQCKRDQKVLDTFCKLRWLSYMHQFMCKNKLYWAIFAGMSIYIFSIFSFKAILLYGRVHFITAALSFKPQIITKNVLQTVASSMRRNNYDHIK